MHVRCPPLPPAPPAGAVPRDNEKGSIAFEKMCRATLPKVLVTGEVALATTMSMTVKVLRLPLIIDHNLSWLITIRPELLPQLQGHTMMRHIRRPIGNQPTVLTRHPITVS